MSLPLFFQSSSAASYTLTAETGTVTVVGASANFGIGRHAVLLEGSGGAAGGWANASIILPKRRRIPTHAPIAAATGSVVVRGHDATFTVGGRDELWVLGLLDIEEAA